MFCLNLMRIALELAKENPAYTGMATKFFEHYAYIGHAMKRMSGRDYELWSEEDGFFYDVLGQPRRRLPQVARAIAGGADSAVRDGGPRGRVDQAVPGVSGRRGMVHAQSRPVHPDVCDQGEAGRRQASPRDGPGDRRPIAANAAARLGPRRVPQPLWPAQPVEAPRKASLRLRPPHRGLRAGRSALPDQGRQLELARPRVVPDVVSDHRVAAEAVGGLRPEVHD